MIVLCFVIADQGHHNIYLVRMLYSDLCGAVRALAVMTYNIFKRNKHRSHELLRNEP